jgi:hypothetical protein
MCIALVFRFRLLRKKTGSVAVLIRHEEHARFLREFEFIRLIRTARAEKPSELGSTRDLFDIGSVPYRNSSYFTRYFWWQFEHSMKSRVVDMF